MSSLRFRYSALSPCWNQASSTALQALAARAFRLPRSSQTYSIYRWSLPANRRQALVHERRSTVNLWRARVCCWLMT